MKNNLLGMIVGAILSIGTAFLAFGGIANAALLASNNVVYDSQTNLMWLQDANTFRTQLASNPDLVSDIIAAVPIIYDTPNGFDNTGTSGQYSLSPSDFSSSFGMTWWGAQGWVGYLSSINYLGFSDWRLPTVAPVNGINFNYTSLNDPTLTYNGSTDRAYNITSTQSEMSHLFYALGNNGNFDISGNVLNIESPILADPFINMTKDSAYSLYWSGTEYGLDPKVSWYFDIHTGAQSAGPGKNTFGNGWVVRSVDPTAIPEPGVVWLVGLGLPLLLSAKHRKFTRPGRDSTKLGLYARTLGIFLMPVETGKIRTNLSCM